MAEDLAGAEYTKALADLEFQEKNTLGLLGEEEGELRTTIGGDESTLTQGEPGTYQAEQYRANKGGLLNSTSNTARKTTIASGYAQKRTVNQAKLRQGEAVDQRKREGVEGEYAKKRSEDAFTKTRAEESYTAANPTVAPVGTAVPVATIQGRYGPVSTTPAEAAGGVVPSEGGGVRVGHLEGQVATPAQRAAAQRIIKVKASS
jgi:hypothetical protein